MGSEDRSTMKFNLKAFALHLLASLLVIGVVAFFILTLWYPSIWSDVLGGYELFKTIVIIDIIAGPLCVGLVYKSSKRLRERISDVAIISLVQLAFLGYGLWIVSEARPAYIIFSDGYYEVIAATDVDQDHLGSDPPFDRLPLTGPQYGALNFKGVTGITLQGGGDLLAYPNLYTEIEAERVAIEQVKIPYSTLPEGELKEQLYQYSVKASIAPEEIALIPVRYRAVSGESLYGFATALLVGDELTPREYLTIDGFQIRKQIEQLAMPPKEQPTAIISREIEQIIGQEYEEESKGITLYSQSAEEAAESLSEGIDAIIQQEEEQ